MERWENKVKVRTGNVLLGIARRLPAIWKARRAARRAASDMKEYEGVVELPDQATLWSWIEGLCATDHRRPGTPEGHRAEAWVADRFRELGLEDVRLDPIGISVWTARRWSLTAAGQELPSFYVPNTGFTGPEGVEAPLVYVGAGGPGAFDRRDVAGKLVVADVPFPRMPTGLLLKVARACYHLSDPDGAIGPTTSQFLNFARQNFVGGASGEDAPEHDVYWQAVRRGARGVCLILRDQPGNSNTHYGPYDGIMKPMPGLWIGRRDGERLRALAARGASARLVLEGAAEPGVMHNVWGVLPGQSDEAILVTSHHDSPFRGAVEDGAGMAQVLAQAWAWSRVPRAQRPRTLVFVADAGHFYGSEGGHAFAREHAGLMRRTRVVITLEHLAGKEVEARGDRYVETGRQALTVMFTSPDPLTTAAAVRALERGRPRVTASIPADLLGPAPTSDAAGYVLEAGVPVISWIGCPYYLLDEHDTLDKVEQSELGPVAETVTELVKTYMALPAGPPRRPAGSRPLPSA
jgi:hypothetical protein